MKYKNVKRVILVLLSMLLLTFILIRPGKTNTNRMIESNTEDDVDMHVFDNPTKQLEGMKLVAENDCLELYLDEAETDIAVRVKESGDTWFSNPQAATEDSIASPYYQKKMKSQFSIQYFNDFVQSGEMDNFNDCIKDGQFTIDISKEAITITYTLGELASKLLLPDVISEERMNFFTDQMEAKSARKVKRYYTFLDLSKMGESEKKENIKLYPGLETHNIYVLKERTKDYIRKDIMEIFTSVGYTQEDLERDSEENGTTRSDSKPWFKIPLTYALAKDNLLVSIDPESIEYNTDGYHLVKINLMEYFGVAGTDESGYMFVPDGSGALIHLNNGKLQDSSYSAAVYGQDLSLNNMTAWKSDIDEKLTVKLPVYGLKTDNRAWFAIIEEGDGYSTINAEVSGNVTSYNHVFPTFTYLNSGEISLDKIVGTNSFQMYSEPVFSGSYKLRYAFLHGESASYSGMAHYYRDYLINKGKLFKNDQGNEARLYINFIGAIEKYKSTLGIKHQSIETLTTYAQAEKITDILKDAGVDKLNIVYSGWSKGGLEGDAITNTKPLSELNKGNISLKKYLNDMKEQNTPVFLTTDFQYVYQDKIFDGYNQLSYAPRYFDNTVVKTGKYNIADEKMPERNINLISPFYIQEVVDTLNNKIQKYSEIGVNVGSLSYNLYSDYYSTRYTDRQMAIEYYKAAMSSISSKYDEGVIGENANAYSLPYVKVILNAPLDSNRYHIIDEVVPFYEMVIRGSIKYTGEAINLADDFQTTFLKSIEYGAGLYFQWIYENNDIVKDTKFDDLYSVNYESWIEKAIEYYQKMDVVFSKLEGQMIVNHEQIDKDIYKTTYDQGTEIIVNYNEVPVNIDGVKIGANDFAVLKEGK